MSEEVIIKLDDEAEEIYGDYYVNVKRKYRNDEVRASIIHKLCLYALKLSAIVVLMRKYKMPNLDVIVTADDIRWAIKFCDYCFASHCRALELTEKKRTPEEVTTEFALTFPDVEAPILEKLTGFKAATIRQWKCRAKNKTTNQL